MPLGVRGSHSLESACKSVTNKKKTNKKNKTKSCKLNLYDHSRVQKNKKVEKQYLMAQ